MFDYTKCLKITRKTNLNDTIIEHCSDHSVELVDFYVVCIDDGIQELKEYIKKNIRRNAEHCINLLEKQPKTVFKMLLSIDSSIKVNSYTELFIRDYGGIQNLISNVHSQDNMEVTDEFDETNKEVKPLDLFKTDSNVVPVSLEKPSKEPLIVHPDMSDSDVEKAKDTDVLRLLKGLPNNDDILLYKKLVNEALNKLDVLNTKLNTGNLISEPLITKNDLESVKLYFESYSDREVKDACIKVLTLLTTVNDFKMISDFLEKFTEVIEG